LIPKNTPLPAAQSRRFQTARAGQSSVQVAVVEGESPRPEHCIPLGKCVIRDLPAELPRGTRIDVRYEYAANGRLSVSASIPATGQSADVAIERGMTDEFDDLARWRRRLCPSLADDDADDDKDDAEQSPNTGDSNRPRGPERAKLLKQLDELYVRLGTQAIGVSVIAWLEEVQQDARGTAEAMREAERTLQRVETTYEATVDPVEKPQVAAMVARARLDVQNARAKARFALIDLGRECADAEFAPPGLEPLLGDIGRLRAAVKSE